MECSAQDYNNVFGAFPFYVDNVRDILEKVESSVASTAQTLMEARWTLLKAYRGRLRCRSIVVPVPTWMHMFGEPTFKSCLDPVSRMDLIEEGLVGVIYGIDVLCDGSIEQTTRFMSNSESMYFILGR